MTHSYGGGEPLPETWCEPERAWQTPGDAAPRCVHPPANPGSPVPLERATRSSATPEAASTLGRPCEPAAACQERASSYKHPECSHNSIVVTTRQQCSILVTSTTQMSKSLAIYCNHHQQYSITISRAFFIGCPLFATCLVATTIVSSLHPPVCPPLSLTSSSSTVQRRLFTVDPVYWTFDYSVLLYTRFWCPCIDFNAFKDPM